MDYSYREQCGTLKKDEEPPTEICYCIEEWGEDEKELDDHGDVPLEIDVNNEVLVYVRGIPAWQKAVLLYEDNDEDAPDQVRANNQAHTPSTSNVSASVIARAIHRCRPPPPIMKPTQHEAPHANGRNTTVHSRTALFTPYRRNRRVGLCASRDPLDPPTRRRDSSHHVPIPNLPSCRA
ncbi:hypothetical protein GGU11DRAFT_751082 [Lentinula aff. detonsa]|nr:hypothetical protein GGU11DRAFT_751082 [Lentinula aff. detonsa]